MESKDIEELGSLIRMMIFIEFGKEVGVASSGNLLKTMTINYNGKRYRINIPAPKYNRKKWEQEHIIQYTYKGSYASDLDIRGANKWIGHKEILTGEHKDYIDRAITKAIEVWSNLHNAKITEKRIK